MIKVVVSQSVAGTAYQKTAHRIMAHLERNPDARKIRVLIVGDAAQKVRDGLSVVFRFFEKAGYVVEVVTK